MKTLLVASVALLLVMGSLEVNAKRVFFHGRQLLNDANPSRKVTTGPNHKRAAPAVQVDQVNDDDDDPDSGSDSHRYFPCEQRNCKKT